MPFAYIQILHNLLSENKTEEKPCNTDFGVTTKKSYGVVKGQVKDGALTLFYSKELHEIGEKIGKYVMSQLCFKNFSLGGIWDPDHPLWHNSNREISQDHTHFVRRNSIFKPEPIQKEDLKCIFKAFQEFDQKNKRCKNGKDDCFLSDEDAEKILKHHQASVNSKLEDVTVTPLMKSQFMSGLAAFLEAFQQTLVQHYLKPALITNNYSQEFIESAISVINIAMKVLFTNSLVQLPTAFFVKIFFSGILYRLGLHQETVETITSNVATVVNVVNNPFSLIEDMTAGMSAYSGQRAAYRLINKLPKLREESQETSANINTEVVNNNLPPTLTKRGRR